MCRKWRLLAAILAAVIAMTALAGCSSKYPTEKEAKAYVQAMLDLMCTGDYDHSVKLADVEEGKETEFRDAMIDEMLAEFGQDQGLSDDVVEQFREYMINAFAKCKYSVGDAVKTAEGEYDVTVTIESLKLFEGVSAEYQEAFSKVVSERSAEIALMSEQEVNDLIMLTLIDILNEHLEDPVYTDPQDETVHYGLLDQEKDVYGCSKEDGEKLGALLFSTEGL